MRTAIIVAALALLTMGARAEPVAMIVHLTGKAEVRHGGGAPSPARLLQKLDVGDRVRCLPGGEAGLVMVTGGKRFLLGPGQSGQVTDTAIEGARQMAGLRAPSLEAGAKLAGTQAGVNFARPRGSEAVALVTDFKGWLPAGTREFRWSAKDRFQVDRSTGGRPPASCAFSLFDRAGFLVWSARSANSQVTYPADLPALETGVPYVWRLDAYDEKGKPIGDKLPWGIITFLDEDQAKQLKEQTADLEKQIQENPKDAAATVMLAEKYRQFGVLMYAIKLVDTLPLLGEASEGADKELYREAGSLALLLSGSAVPEQNPAQNKDIH